MKWCIPSMLLLLSACSEPIQQHSTEVPEESMPIPVNDAYSQSETVISGIDLFLWGKAIAELEQSPVFKLHARQAAAMNEAGYRFEDAEAWAYNNETGAEEFHLNATRGIFKQNEQAYLEGEVRANTGTMNFAMQDITWAIKEDGTSYAWTEKPLTVSGDEMKIDAEGLELFPDEQRLLLKNIHGTIQLGAMGIQ